VTALQITPGRLVQPVEAASYDAWIKYYRPDETAGNASISYYTKGAVIGFLLDARLRPRDRGAKTLDDLMRLMFERFSGARGYTTRGSARKRRRRWQGLRAAPGCGSGWRRRWTQPRSSDYREALDWFGLQFRPLPEKPRPSLGVRTRVDGSGPS
jgi:predicted metalloprotease with PDZ domain